MAERLNHNTTFISSMHKWRIGNDFIGIDYVKANSQNNLRLYILLCDTTLSFSLRQIGISIRILKFHIIANIGIQS